MLFWTIYHRLLVVATTCRNGTCDMLTSAKLSVGYLVVGITRELDKEPSLHCSSIYINTRWSVLQQCVYLMSYYSSTMILLQGHHAISMCPDVILFNLRHHVYTMGNHCPLTSSLILTPSRLFLILLDPKSFQTILASVIWLPGHMPFSHCRLIIILLSYFCLNPNPTWSLSTHLSYNTTRITFCPATNSNLVMKFTIKCVHSFSSTSLNFNFSVGISILFFILWHILYLFTYFLTFLITPGYQ